jgi:HD-GYP domain-containing protein (c-di-GMP phosphodiesterase class II)
VGALVVAVGQRVGLADRQLRELRYGAAFHDVGKISVPDAILAKPGPLESSEREAIERHPVVGEQMLAPIELLRDVRPLIRHEHERFDGNGYPDGLAGDDIPLGSRVLHACAAYDAMRSDRPYRPALSEEKARSELRGGSGTQFDPAVVDALITVLDEGVPPAESAAASPESQSVTDPL